MASSATAADEGQQPENRQQALGAIQPVDLSSAEPEQNQVKFSTGESCSPIASSARAALGGAVKACVETKSLESASTIAARTAKPVAAAEACAITQPGYWGWTRTGGICLNGMQTTYTLYGDKGAVLGTGRRDVKSSMDLSSTSTTWNELLTVKVTAVTGQVKNLNIAFDVQCTSACSPISNRPWAGVKTLGLGAQASGSVTYKSNVASGTRDSFQTKYHMYVTTTGSIPTQPNVNWDSPVQAKLRCDAELSTPGCVIPERRANLEYSLSDPKHGSAAAVYSFAQDHLRDWAPLSRADGLSVANRERTCGAKSSDPFLPMPDYVPNDSCDEFPFAGSLEGGTNGALCADILPLYENGQWMIYEARTDKPVTYTEPCVRGHVALDANESAGGKYGAFVKSQRILDIEKYNVNIVA
ncbi:hypothetical protein RB625_23220 [Streptomyces californicus]|uniref:hypothetical protein n=1 Tax=Streptomyces californicus TaxID=67351 RepID=UPI00296F6BDB|nr:hypothetical protein [Streptomyces californicus]MDW4901327.1 hypothetical protein [Streptomyces californicus]